MPTARHIQYYWHKLSKQDRLIDLLLASLEIDCCAYKRWATHEVCYILQTSVLAPMLLCLTPPKLGPQDAGMVPLNLLLAKDRTAICKDTGNTVDRHESKVLHNE